MLRAIKYELNPNNTQKELIRRTCGCCRLVYNTMLDRKIKAYKEDKTVLSAYDLIRQITLLKIEKPFLKEVSIQGLQQSIINLESAYKEFFRKGGVGFPKYKKKKSRVNYRIPSPCKIDYDKWQVKITKIGWVKFFRGHNKQIEGTIKSYTISHTSTDRYYISILYETADKPKLNNGKSVGIDLGIKDFAILSDGKVFENQKYLKSNLRKLRVLQRTASRRYQQGKKREEQSHNWFKAQKQVAKLHEKIRFQRQDYLHKISTWIARNYSTVCVENLNVKGMESNHRLAQSISDIGWNGFVQMLVYKCDNLVKVDRFFASSQTCSECGYVNKDVKDLAIRSWVCPECGVRHDRDLNAAKNIAREGLSLCGLNVSGYAERAPRVSLNNMWT